MHVKLNKAVLVALLVVLGPCGFCDEPTPYKVIGAANCMVVIPVIKENYRFSFIVALETTTDWIVFTQLAEGEKFVSTKTADTRLQVKQDVSCLGKTFRIEDAISKQCPPSLVEFCSANDIAGLVSADGLPFKILEFDNAAGLFRAYDSMQYASFSQEDTFKLIRGPESSYCMLTSVRNIDWAFELRSTGSARPGLNEAFMRSVYGAERESYKLDFWGKGFSESKAGKASENSLNVIGCYKSRKVLLDKNELLLRIGTHVP